MNCSGLAGGQESIDNLRLWNEGIDWLTVFVMPSALAKVTLVFNVLFKVELLLGTKITF